MRIENETTATLEEMRQQLRDMDDAMLQAQELVQKGALDALHRLRRFGVTEANLESMLATLTEISSVVSEETRRRGLAIVDHPGGN